MSSRDTKKSREEIRPSMCEGTRRCSRVPQMTWPAPPVAPNTHSAPAMTHHEPVIPTRPKGSVPKPQSQIMVVRYFRGSWREAITLEPTAVEMP